MSEERRDDEVPRDYHILLCRQFKGMSDGRVIIGGDGREGAGA